MNKRPWQLLPLPAPKDYDPSEVEPDYFYRNILKPLNRDFIRIMSNGLHVNQDAVEELRTTVTEVVEKVQQTLNANPIIQAFQKIQYKKKYNEYMEEMETKKKSIKDFLKPYKPNDMIHRTYVVNTVLKDCELSEYICTKWTINDIKKFSTIIDLPVLRSVIAGTLKESSEYVVEAMKVIAEEKMRIYNKSHYEDKVSTVTREKLLPDFNPGSSNQKRELFEYLNISPLAYSNTSGEGTWGRDQIEEVLHTLSDSDADLKEILQCFIDHSYSAIIKNNFMEAFDRFVVDSKLHGNLNLFGAKTARPTSNSPNLLNSPSTGSIYAKPLKKCFIAPPGYLIWTIDFASLEDKVIANLTGDINKIATQVDKELDAHLFHAVVYFRSRFVELLGDLPHRELAIAAKKAMDEGNKEIKELRQTSKSVTLTDRCLHTVMYVENYINAGTSKHVMM